MNKFDEIRAKGLAKYFYKLAEQSQDIFWIRSVDYQEQIYISPAFEEVWGIPIQRLYDDPSLWITTLYPEDRDRLEHDCANKRGLPKIGDNFEKNYRIVRSDQTLRWIKDISFGLFDTSNKCFAYAGICKDVSKEMGHQQEIQEAKLNAEAANQAKADFLAMMSHELRTPLNAIIGMTQIMRMKGLTPELDEYVNIITQAGSNLLSLVNDILDFAKLESGQLSFSSDPINLFLLISQVTHSLSHQLSQDTQLNLIYPDHVPKLVMGDAKRIRQIVINLIANAIKFTEKGHIEVNVEFTKKSIHDGIFTIQVKDTGIGIPADKLVYIFEKFSQIESIYQRKHQGTGLGLSIIKQLVEKIGGDISVQSEVNKGSIFSFTLPLSLQATFMDKMMLDLDTPPLKSIEKNFNLNLLLVEDNLVNQKIAKIMLEEVGCQVTIKENGQAALEDINQLNNYDLILLDIGLPDINGFEVATQIRKQAHLRTIPIVALTAHILESDKQKCYAAGMNDIIAKPIPYEQLIEVLTQYQEA